MGGCRGGWIQGLAVGRAPCCCPSWRRDGTPSCWERPDPQSTADHSTGKAGAGHWARRLQTGSWALDWWWKERESISQRTAGGGTMRLLSVLRRAFLSLGYCLMGETESISWLQFMPYPSSSGNIPQRSHQDPQGILPLASHKGPEDPFLPSKAQVLRRISVFYQSALSLTFHAPTPTPVLPDPPPQ